MSIIYEPIPTPYHKPRNEDDHSDDCTVMGNNLTQTTCMNSDVSNDDTAATQPSTDIETDNGDDKHGTNAPTRVVIPYYMLPWGGRSVNKTAAKWERIIKKREV